MKHVLLNEITNDINKLQELTFTNIDDSENSEELLLLLKKMKERLNDFEDIIEIAKIYNNLQLSIKILLDSYMVMVPETVNSKTT